MTVVDTATGEIVVDLTADEARVIVDRVKVGVDNLREDIVRLYAGRAWIALGIESWDALCDQEFGVRLALPRVERAELVADLREQGMSTRAIGSALGVGVGTVHRDLAGVPDGTPAPVVGLDGKTYTQPAPERLLTHWPAAAAKAISRYPDLAVKGAPPAEVIKVAAALDLIPPADLPKRIAAGRATLEMKARGDSVAVAPNPCVAGERIADAARAVATVLTDQLEDFPAAWMSAPPVLRWAWVGTLTDLRTALDQAIAVTDQQSLRSV